MKFIVKTVVLYNYVSLAILTIKVLPDVQHLAGSVTEDRRQLEDCLNNCSFYNHIELLPIEADMSVFC